MDKLMRRVEPVLAAALFFAGMAFLLKMCYLSLRFNTLFGILFLLAFDGYVRRRYGLKVPPVLLFLVLGAIEVDAVGNYFRMYGQRFGPVSYDEFAHFSVQALTAPLVIWIAREGFVKSGHRLPLGVIAFFAVITLFSLSAFYEIIELWDELYFSGQRIWSPHDAPNDLQWNLAGAVFGALLTYAVLRASLKAQADKGQAV